MTSAAAMASKAGHGTAGGVGAEDHSMVAGGVAAGGRLVTISRAGCADAGAPEKTETASTSTDIRVKLRNIGAILA